MNANLKNQVTTPEGIATIISGVVIWKLPESELFGKVCYDGKKPTNFLDPENINAETLYPYMGRTTKFSVFDICDIYIPGELTEIMVLGSFFSNRYQLEFFNIDIEGTIKLPRISLNDNSKSIINESCKYRAVNSRQLSVLILNKGDCINDLGKLNPGMSKIVKKVSLNQGKLFTLVYPEPFTPHRVEYVWNVLE